MIIRLLFVVVTLGSFLAVAEVEANRCYQTFSHGSFPVPLRPKNKGLKPTTKQTLATRSNQMAQANIHALQPVKGASDRKVRRKVWDMLVDTNMSIGHSKAIERIALLYAKTLEIDEIFSTVGYDKTHPGMIEILRQAKSAWGTGPAKIPTENLVEVVDWLVENYMDISAFKPPGTRDYRANHAFYAVDAYHASERSLFSLTRTETYMRVLRTENELVEKNLRQILYYLIPRIHQHLPQLLDARKNAERMTVHGYAGGKIGESWPRGLRWIKSGIQGFGLGMTLFLASVEGLEVVAGAAPVLFGMTGGIHILGEGLKRQMFRDFYGVRRKLRSIYRHSRRGRVPELAKLDMAGSFLPSTLKSIHELTDKTEAMLAEVADVENLSVSELQQLHYSLSQGTSLLNSYLEELQRQVQHLALVFKQLENEYKKFDPEGRPDRVAEQKTYLWESLGLLREQTEVLDELMAAASPHASYFLGIAHLGAQNAPQSTQPGTLIPASQGQGPMVMEKTWGMIVSGFEVTQSAVDRAKDLQARFENDLVKQSISFDVENESAEDRR